TAMSASPLSRGGLRGDGCARPDEGFREMPDANFGAHGKDEPTTEILNVRSKNPASGSSFLSLCACIGTMNQIGCAPLPTLSLHGEKRVAEGGETGECAIPKTR